MTINMMNIKMKVIMKKSILLYLLLLNFSIILIASEALELIVHQKSCNEIEGEIAKNESFTQYSELPTVLKSIVADYAGLNDPEWMGAKFTSHKGSLYPLDKGIWTHLPLTEYIKNHDFSAVAILINCGALVNGLNPYNQRCLLYEAVSSLSFAYSNTNVPDNENNIKNAIKIIHFLIVKEADLNQISPDADNMTALHEAADTNENPTALHILIAAGASLNIESSRYNGKTPLDIAQHKARVWYHFPTEREQGYQNSLILENAGAESSFTLPPMPTSEIMERQRNTPYSR